MPGVIGVGPPWSHPTQLTLWAYKHSYPRGSGDQKIGGEKNSAPGYNPRIPTPLSIY